jgi:putative colanic acid biosynthesis UDP-glucose lipid carrier transferase
MEKTNTGNHKNKGKIYSPLYTSYNSIIKRAFDLMVSIVMLCSFFPIICLIVGVFIKLTSPGPIFFVQKRTGKDGQDFNCYKFRSMVVNQDADKLQATANDPRKTPLGNFIRNTSIDEIPQLINVFLGNMSLVGPRPHMVKHTEMYSKLIDNYMDRHTVKPGITGWAQVTGLRGETKELSQMENRVKADIWYIQNWSFLLDMKILMRTALTILLGDKNAY